MRYLTIGAMSRLGDLFGKQHPGRIEAFAVDESKALAWKDFQILRCGFEEERISTRRTECPSRKV
jgi:hypothetical protein